MNMNKMLEDAQRLQKEMEDLQKRLETETIEISYGGGAVKVSITASGKIKSIEMSEDLHKGTKAELVSVLLKAIKEAQTKSEQRREEALRPMTENLQRDLPDMDKLQESLKGLEDLEKSLKELGNLNLGGMAGPQRRTGDAGGMQV